MQSVLISIKPQWCAKIANGEKTIEVRKSRPKLETPFKCYIYCTQGGNHLCLMQNPDGVNLIACCNWKTALPFGGSISNGKVIGEFVCDELSFVAPPYGSKTERTCLTAPELYDYSLKGVWYWHISALQIYDKPRELSEFTKFGYDSQMPCCRINRPPQSWGYVEEYDGKR